MKFRASRSMRVPAFAALIVLLLAPTLARGQDTTTTGVRLGLTYTAGTKPGVIVLPLEDPTLAQVWVIDPTCNTSSGQDPLYYYATVRR